METQTTTPAASNDVLDFLSEADFATSIEDLEAAFSDSAESLSVENLNFDWDSDTVSFTESSSTTTASLTDATVDLTCNEEICFVSDTHSCVDCQDVTILQPRKKYAGCIGSGRRATTNSSSTNYSNSTLSIFPDVSAVERKYHFPSPIDQLWCPGCHKAVPVFAKEQDHGEILIFRKRNYGFKGFNAIYPYRYELFFKIDGKSTRIADQKGYCSQRCFRKSRSDPFDGYLWKWTFEYDEFVNAYDQPGVRIDIPSYVDKKLTFSEDWFWEPMLFDRWATA